MMMKALCSTDVEAALGAVVPQQTEIRRVDTRADEYIEVLVNDVFHLQHTTETACQSTM